MADSQLRDAVLARLGELWGKYPHMRLCQLLCDLSRKEVQGVVALDIWNISDEDLLVELERRLSS